MEVKSCDAVYYPENVLPPHVAERTNLFFATNFTQGAQQVFAGLKAWQPRTYEFLSGLPILLGEKCIGFNAYRYGLFCSFRENTLLLNPLTDAKIEIYQIGTGLPQDPLVGMPDFVRAYYAYGINGLNGTYELGLRLPEDVSMAPTIDEDFRKLEKYRKNVFDKILADFNGHRLVRLLRNSHHENDDMLFYDTNNREANQLIHVHKRRFDDYVVIENAAEVLDRYCVQVLSTGDSTFDFRA